MNIHAIAFSKAFLGVLRKNNNLTKSAPRGVNQKPIGIVMHFMTRLIALPRSEP